MATVQSLEAWSKAWLATAKDYRDIAAYEAGFVNCRDLPARVRQECARLASKFVGDAIECEGYAATGVRF